MHHLPMIKINRGFTLVEVMVAILVMIVGMLGLLEMINVTLQNNLKNQLRAESVRVGERCMAQLRGRAFDNIFGSYTVVPSKIRGSAINYSVERSTQVLATDGHSNPTSRQLTVVVKWGFKNISSQNTVVSVVAR